MFRLNRTNRTSGAGTETHTICCVKRFSIFSELELALEELKKDRHHPLRVISSKKGADYNKEQLIHDS